MSKDGGVFAASLATGRHWGSLASAPSTLPDVGGAIFKGRGKGAPDRAGAPASLPKPWLGFQK